MQPIETEWKVVHMKGVILLAFLSIMTISSRCWSITRQEVMSAATAEASRSYQSAPTGTQAIWDNVYDPNYLKGGCSGHCIDHIYDAWLRIDSLPQQHSWYGAPFCYGGISMGSDCQDKIGGGYGVGASYWQWVANSRTTYTWAAGIDCSHFVCECLGIEYHSTSRLPEVCTQINWDELQQGDVLIWPGQHVMFFKQWDDPERTYYTVIHASNDPYEDGSSRVWVEPSRSKEGDNSTGYKPYSPDCISGGTAASLGGFRVERAGGVPVLIWQTECERDTREFWIERSPISDGAWQKVTESIPKRGTNTTGAEYRVPDPTYPGGRVYYRLIEQEIGWRVVIKREAMFE